MIRFSERLLRYISDMAKVRPLDLFCYEKKQHIDLLLPEIWSKAVNKRTKFFMLPRNCNFIITYFEWCGPRWKTVFKFGPRSKKSDHPWYILYWEKSFLWKKNPRSQNHSYSFLTKRQDKHNVFGSKYKWYLYYTSSDRKKVHLGFEHFNSGIWHCYFTFT